MLRTSISLHNLITQQDKELPTAGTEMEDQKTWDPVSTLLCMYCFFHTLLPS